MEQIEVHIFGQTYVIKGDASPEYMKEIAQFVDAQLKEVYSHFPNITPLKAAILAALNIADELHKTKHECTHLTQGMRELEDKADSIMRLFE
jgi:cell division protein ZapA